MQIPPSLLSGQVTLTVTPKELSSWQVGQLLKAVVTATPTPESAVLQVGTQTLTARMSFPVQPGQVLELQVQTLGPQPQLQAVRPGPVQDPALAALREALPRQDSLTPLLANVALLARTPAPPLPDLVTQALRTLFKTAPPVRQTTTREGLRQALEDSGVFMEAKLAREAKDGTPAQPQKDFKAALLNLRDALRKAVTTPPKPSQTAAPTAAAETPSATQTLGEAARTAAAAPTPARAAATLVTTSEPPLPDAHPQPQARAAATLQMLDTDPSTNLHRLLHQTEAALARVQLSQLSSQHVDRENAPPMWLLEIPLRQGTRMDLLQLRIERDPAPGGGADTAKADHRWSVELALALDGLGPLHARVGVQGDRVSTVWWAERPESARTLRNNLNELESRLNSAGLEPTQLVCHEGAPPRSRPGSPSGPLVDEKA